MSLLLIRSRGSSTGLVTAGLQAMFEFDAGVGQVLADTSGNSRHGTLGSSAGADSNDPAWTSEGLDFTLDDYVEATLDAGLSPDAWTICAAAKLGVGQAVPTLGWSPSGATPGAYAAAPFNNNRPLIWLGNSCFRYFESNNPVDLQDSGWHFLAFTCPGNTATDIQSSVLLADGQQQAVNSTTATASGDAKTVFRIGSAGSAAYGQGVMAFFSIHDRALSSVELESMREFARTRLAGRVTLP